MGGAKSILGPAYARAPPPCELSPNARRVLDARYLRRDEKHGTIETPEEFFGRVAHAAASAEALLGNKGRQSQWEETFLGMLSNLEFLPNSPALINAGGSLPQMSACFVLPIEDSTESIFDAVKQMALIQRTGGGTGFSFSRLRPAGAWIESTGGKASGPVSFMKVFDAATEHIRRGGRRRGANMGVLRVDHPDILEFIDAKLEGDALQNFNLSVGITDEFMLAVESNAHFPLRHPQSLRTVSTLDARAIFDAIVNAAWRSGDPGLLFLDAINRANPTPALGPIEATNPCGEVPLLPWEACILGSVNLARMLKGSGNGAAVDWSKLRLTVRNAVRFLDNLIEINRYPAAEMERMARANRKIGLGVMGFAEALIRLGIPYGSREASAFAHRLMACIEKAALEQSAHLASKRGVFPNWNLSIYPQQGLELRNAARTAIAPTGTISIIAGTTAGIEPLFALAYRRVNVLEGQTLVEINYLLHEFARDRGLSSDNLEDLVQGGTLQETAAVPDDLRRIFQTALQIPHAQHLMIQAAFQRHVDGSVSKTINMAEDSTREDVSDAFLRAWKLGLKGVTVYRYGSRVSQVLQLGASESASSYEHQSRCDPEECRV